jgi:hypothetical protein
VYIFRLEDPSPPALIHQIVAKVHAARNVFSSELRKYGATYTYIQAEKQLGRLGTVQGIMAIPHPQYRQLRR